MILKPNCGSERAWVWSTPADFADEEQKQELLALKLASVDGLCELFLINMNFKYNV